MDPLLPNTKNAISQHKFQITSYNLQKNYKSHGTTYNLLRYTTAFLYIVIVIFLLLGICNLYIASASPWIKRKVNFGIYILYTPKNPIAFAIGHLGLYILNAVKKFLKLPTFL
jgi:hypothetical protein